MERWLVTYTTPQEGVLWDSPEPEWSWETDLDTEGQDHGTVAERLRAMIHEHTLGKGVYKDATRLDG